MELWVAGIIQFILWNKEINDCPNRSNKSGKGKNFFTVKILQLKKWLCRHLTLFGVSNRERLKN